MNNDDFKFICEQCPEESILVILKTMQEVDCRNKVIEIIKNKPSGNIFFDKQHDSWKNVKKD